MYRKILFSVLLIVTTSLFFFGKEFSVHAQVDTLTPTPTPDNSVTISDLQKQIQDLQGKISDLQGQEKTLSSQIDVMDNQIKLTELRIQSTEQQINDLTINIDTANQKINTISSSLDNLTKVLLNRVVATYEVGTIQPLQMLLTSSDVSDFLKRLNYLKIAQAHDKRVVFDAVQAKNDYANQKQIYEDQKNQVETLKAQLDAYTTQLSQEKKQKTQLLSDTQGSEANYQQQLAQARTQLSALSGYGLSASGGVSILPHEELSDKWGRYFNQRDAYWGNTLINGQSSGCGKNNKTPCTVWLVGCLITSYAMVADYYGASMTPGDVATSGNFWPGTASFNKPGPSANGHSVTYVADPDINSLVNDVRNGDVVIAGMSMNGGSVAQGYWSDHWVVLRGVDGNGNFIINDPEYQGAMGVSIKDHYASWKIIEARIYQ